MGHNMEFFVWLLLLSYSRKGKGGDFVDAFGSASDHDISFCHSLDELEVGCCYWESYWIA
jgi:hypothetical protein